MLKNLDKFPGLLRIIFRASPIGLFLLALFTAASALMPTAAMALATAHFVDTAMAVLQNLQPRGDIYIPLFLLIFIMGINTTTGAAIELVNARIRLNLTRKLNRVMVEKHAALDYKHIENNDSWEIIFRVTGDPIPKVMEGLAAYMTLFWVILNVAAVLGLILLQVWWAAIVVFGVSVPLFKLSFWAGRQQYSAMMEAEKCWRRTGYLDEVITGRENVDERTLFGYGGFVADKWQYYHHKARKIYFKAVLMHHVMSRNASICMVLVSLLVAATLLNPVATGAITPGMFMGILAAVFSMIGSLGWSMSESLNHISKAREYMKDLHTFTQFNEAEGATETPMPEQLIFESLEFKNVSFTYPSGKTPVLDALSFTLKAGGHYAFVGKNGAGKTTITKLLTGLYSEYGGEILINGKELRTYNSREIKALFSVVYQDFAQYHISLRDNILVGDISGDARDARVQAALQSAGLTEAVAGLSDGIHSHLGKIKTDGQDLSGGQWQRVAIARSLFSRAPVKMLDEPTAALDPISESQIYEEFEKLMRGKTTIFISHRLGSTKLADEILVIDGSNIAERGTHDALMQAQGIYAEMFESQRSWYQ